MGTPYRVEAEWSRVVFGQRSGAVAAFFLPHLQPGMSLIDVGCGPGSITVDLAEALAPGTVVGVDIRADALEQGRALAQERRATNVTFEEAGAERLPYSDGSFDAAWMCAVLQHLPAPVEALKEVRRVLKPGGVIGIADGSSPVTFRYPTNRLLEIWDGLRGRDFDPGSGRRPTALELRTLLREAGFARTAASAEMAQEAGPPAGTHEETRRVARNHLIQVQGVRGRLAVERGLVTDDDLAQIAEALIAWGDDPDAVYARPVFTAIGWT
jgi:ubiquinone/menaquinone biosynthesis C-methylase UbiE